MLKDYRILFVLDVERNDAIKTTWFYKNLTHIMQMLTRQSAICFNEGADQPETEN